MNSDLRDALDILTRMQRENQRISKRITLCAVLLTISSLLLGLNLVPLAEKLLKSF